MFVIDKYYQQVLDLLPTADYLDRADELKEAENEEGMLDLYYELLPDEAHRILRDLYSGAEYADMHA